MRSRRSPRAWKLEEVVHGVEPSSTEGVEVGGTGAEFQKLEVLGSIPGDLVLSSEEGL